MRITLIALISGVIENRSLEKREIGKVGLDPMRNNVVAKFSKENGKKIVDGLYELQ